VAHSVKGTGPLLAAPTVVGHDVMSLTVKDTGPLLAAPTVEGHGVMSLTQLATTANV
jgi:hypothetical protein